VSAILHVIQQNLAGTSKHRSAVFNLGTDEYCCVTDSIRWICGRLGVEPKLEFTGGERGWVGDNPFIFLDTGKIRSTGWRASLSIRQAVERTVDWLAQNRWVFDSRR
jgi:UDP-glucose 4-epimerase